MPIGDWRKGAVGVWFLFNNVEIPIMRFFCFHHCSKLGSL